MHILSLGTTGFKANPLKCVWGWWRGEGARFLVSRVLAAAAGRPGRHCLRASNGACICSLLLFVDIVVVRSETLKQYRQLAEHAAAGVLYLE